MEITFEKHPFCNAIFGYSMFSDRTELQDLLEGTHSLSLWALSNLSNSNSAQMHKGQKAAQKGQLVKKFRRFRISSATKKPWIPSVSPNPSPEQCILVVLGLHNSLHGWRKTPVDPDHHPSHMLAVDRRRGAWNLKLQIANRRSENSTHLLPSAHRTNMRRAWDMGEMCDTGDMWITHPGHWVSKSPKNVVKWQNARRNISQHDPTVSKGHSWGTGGWSAPVLERFAA